MLPTSIPLAFKLAYTAFVLYVIAVWWRHYGWKNFLWFSDIAFIGAVPALWLESAPIASVLTVAVLIPEVLWNLDYAGRLLLRRRIVGLTDYMFEPERPLILRALSLFHVPLPLVLLWMLTAYGYRADLAVPGAILLAVVVLPWSRHASDARENINWTYGLGARRSTWPAYAYVPALLAALCVLVILPTHALLRWAGF